VFQVLDDYFSAAVGGKSTATHRSRFASFPPVLVVALKRYYVAGGPDALLLPTAPLQSMVHCGLNFQ